MKRGSNDDDDDDGIMMMIIMVMVIDKSICMEPNRLIAHVSLQQQ